MPLVRDEPTDPVIAEWVCAHLAEYELPDEHETLGVVAGDDLIAGVVYAGLNPRTQTVQMWAAGKGNWLTRDKIRALAKHAFDTMGVNRITLEIAAWNSNARALGERLGFVSECTMQDALGPGNDMVIYRMLKSECRWL